MNIDGHEINLIDLRGQVQTSTALAWELTSRMAAVESSVCALRASDQGSSVANDALYTELASLALEVKALRNELSQLENRVSSMAANQLL